MINMNHSLVISVTTRTDLYIERLSPLPNKVFSIHSPFFAENRPFVPVGQSTKINFPKYYVRTSAPVVHYLTNHMTPTAHGT